VATTDGCLITARDVEVLPMPPGARMQTRVRNGSLLVSCSAISFEMLSLPLKMFGGLGILFELGICGGLSGASVSNLSCLKSLHVLYIRKRTLPDFVVVIGRRMNDSRFIHVHCLSCFIRWIETCPSCVFHCKLWPGIVATSDG
jgi:hypothetical protein